LGLVLLAFVIEVEGAVTFARHAVQLASLSHLRLKFGLVALLAKRIRL